MSDSHQTSSIVEYFGAHDNYKCGYCGSPDTNCSHGMWAHTLTVQDYQELIDRGWRRSGKYCYKPTMSVSCCPAYTVRCRVADFKASCSQRKVLRRAFAYLQTGRVPDKAGLRQQRSESIRDEDTRAASMCKPTYRGDTVVGTVSVAAHRVESTGDCFERDVVNQDVNIEVPMHRQSHDVKMTTTKKREPRPGDGADGSKPRCQKAKLLRLEKWKKKQALKGTNEQASCKKASENCTKSIEDILGDILENPAHRLEIKLVRSRPRSRQFDASFDESYAVYKKYQIEIHNDPVEKPSRKQFTHFLVDSPLQHVYVTGGCPEGYGSFHQQYILDGKIIAVGVIDILPKCVSSVYLYYDPDYFFLSPGTYSALREIAFTRYLHSVDHNIEYYYMGYYIHSCPKMKYKGAYKPSYLLCPETYTWHALEDCTPKLDTSSYSRFADPSVKDTNDNTDTKSVMTLHVGQAIPYYVYQHLKPLQAKEDEAVVNEYAHFVGKKCASSLLLYRA